MKSRQPLDLEIQREQELRIAAHRERTQREEPLEEKMSRSLNLATCRTRTPAPTGIGAWAEKLREAAFNAVTESDITDIMKTLIDQAKAGDLAAARLVLGYLTGGGAPRVQQVVVVQEGMVAMGNGDVHREQIADADRLDNSQTVDET